MRLQDSRVAAPAEAGERKESVSMLRLPVAGMMDAQAGQHTKRGQVIGGGERESAPLQGSPHVFDVKPRSGGIEVFDEDASEAGRD